MDERSRRWEARFEWPMVIAALLVIAVLVIEESNFGEGVCCSRFVDALP